MAYLYKWGPISPRGRARWNGKHKGIVVRRVFKIIIDSYDKTDKQWHRYLRNRIYIAYKQKVILHPEGAYDLRIKAYSKPIWKGEFAKADFVG